jgi:hypothetical protein
VMGAMILSTSTAMTLGATGGAAGANPGIPAISKAAARAGRYALIS